MALPPARHLRFTRALALLGGSVALSGCGTRTEPVLKGDADQQDSIAVDGAVDTVVDTVVVDTAPPPCPATAPSGACGAPQRCIYNTSFCTTTCDCTGGTWRCATVCEGPLPPPDLPASV